MLRTIAIAGLAAAMLASLPAQAQQDSYPDLDGGPGSRAAEQAGAKQAADQKKAADQLAVKQAAQKKAADLAAQKQAQAQALAIADKARADQLMFAAQQAEAKAQKAEQARLAQQAADLKTREARLAARAAELDAREKQLEQQRADQDAEYATRLADLDRKRIEADNGRQTQTAGLSDDARDARPRNDDTDDAADAGDTARDLPPPPPGAAPPGGDRDVRRPLYARLDVDAARQSCIRAAEDEAWSRNYYSARYDSAPRVYQAEGWELRGRMRLEDRRGYLLVDTVCEVNAAGETQRFSFLR